MAEAEKNSPPRRNRFVISLNVLVQLVAVLALAGMANWFVARHYLRFDWTKSGYYQVSDKTKQMLGSLKDPVKVIVYLQPNAESDLEEKIFQDVRNLLSEFQILGKDKLVIEYVDPDRDLARAKQIVEDYKIDAQREPALVIFVAGSRNKYVSRAEMADIDPGGDPMSGGGTPRLKSFKAEGAFLSAIQTVTEGEPPSVFFLTGHGEHDPESFDQRTGYSTLATYIKRDNVTVHRWNFQEHQSLPTNASALVIAGPRLPYTAAEQEALDLYLKNHGRLYIMLDAKTQTGLEGFLHKWGVQVDADLVMRKAGTMLGTELIDVNAVATSYARHPVTARLADVNTEFPYARSIRRLPDPSESADQPRVTELALAPKSFWGETDPDNERASFELGRDLVGPLPLVVAVETGQPRDVNVDLGVTRMIVVGTAAAVDNSHLTAGNLDFFMSALNWLLKRDQLLAVGPKLPEEFRLDMTPNEASAVLAITTFGLPLAIGFVGLAVWLRRRK
ncbi:MAG: GldG family protein [Verrucomicrobiota bacterium]